MLWESYSKGGSFFTYTNFFWFIIFTYAAVKTKCQFENYEIFLCNCLLFSAENFHQNQKQNFTFLHLFLPLLNFLFPNFVLKTPNIPIYFWFKKIWHTQCTLIPYESWTLNFPALKLGKFNTLAGICTRKAGFWHSTKSFGHFEICMHYVTKIVLKSGRILVLYNLFAWSSIKVISNVNSTWQSIFKGIKNCQFWNLFCHSWYVEWSLFYT